MAKQEKFLVATDSRLPLTMALAHAFAANPFSPELLASRKQELVDLVSEAAKTFGFQSRTTLTGAFDMATGLLSLALVNGTKGETLPDQWADRLLKDSWKSLVKESITMVRTIKESDDAYDYPFENDKDLRMLRDHLRDFVKSRDSHQQWTGYKAFVRYREERRRNQAVDTLIRLLIKSLVKRSLYWMKDPIEGPTCADEALNTLLFRTTTGLGFAQKDIILTEKEFPPRPRPIRRPEARPMDRPRASTATKPFSPPSPPPCAPPSTPSGSANASPKAPPKSPSGNPKSSPALLASTTTRPIFRPMGIRCLGTLESRCSRGKKKDALFQQPGTSSRSRRTSNVHLGSPSPGQ